MKNLIGKLLVVAVLAVGFASCMKDDDSFLEDQIRNQKRIDSTLNAQKSVLEAYAFANFDDPQKNDSTGIWFEVLEPGDEESYAYTISAGQIIAPTATLKYKGELMNGTVFDETEDDKTRSFSLNGVIYAWQVAFLPQTIEYNNQEVDIIGLTETGLKKGSKIRFIAPSPYCYDNQPKENIPADSPLVFTIEVVDIKNL